jgi:hypothetical protein
MTQPANGYPIPPQHIPPPQGQYFPPPQVPPPPPQGQYFAPPQVPPPPSPAAAAEAQPLFPAAVDEDVPWARQSTAHQPLTGRSRRHLRGLPAWDPLPPGEVLVQRRHRAD